MRPSSGNVTEDVWPSVAPAVPEDSDANSWPAATYVAANCTSLELIDSWVRDTDTGIGWSLLFDPTTAPVEALPWLSQVAGAILTQGLDEAGQRALIERRPGLDRGTIGAIKRDVAATLTGSQTVVIIERNGGPWLMEVVVRTSETPDPVASEAAARAQKPAGILLTFTVSTGETWDEPTATWDSVTTTTWDETLTTTI